MSKPRFRRRKKERPEEITAAALDSFASKGYARTTVEDVAKRAGVSKGLLYLYFKTKEELFRAVVRSVVVPRVNALERSVLRSELTAEELLRGPVLRFMKRIPGSPIAIIIRLMIEEAPRHPDLIEFYWQNVVSHGLGTLQHILEHGVDNGEFRRTVVNELPQLLIAPVIMSVIWKLIFQSRSLDTDRLIESHVDMLISYIRA